MSVVWYIIVWIIFGNVTAEVIAYSPLGEYISYEKDGTLAVAIYMSIGGWATVFVLFNIPLFIATWMSSIETGKK